MIINTLDLLAEMSAKDRDAILDSVQKTLRDRADKKEHEDIEYSEPLEWNASCRSSVRA